MDEKTYDEFIDYLTLAKIPDGLSKVQKHRFKAKAEKYRIETNELKSLTGRKVVKKRDTLAAFELFITTSGAHRSTSSTYNEL